MASRAELSLPVLADEPVDPDPSGQLGWPSLKACGRPVDLFLVCREQDVWRIVHQGHRAGRYATAEAAFAYACKLAQESAGLGYPSAVFKPAAPSAFHGCMPHGRDESAAPAPGRG
jgi:hypothetical protein